MQMTDAAGRKRLPGEEGIWIFVLGDMVVFALFFTGYLYYRSAAIALFNRSQLLLNVDLGVANTLLLLTSSWFVVMGLHSIRAARPGRAQAFLAAALLCGVGFVAIKMFEYFAKFNEGITLLTNDFFMYYFMFTGIHLLHVTIGLGALTVLCGKAAAAAPADIGIFESGATFWHMVDLLWIILFPLLYLVR